MRAYGASAWRNSRGSAGSDAASCTAAGLRPGCGGRRGTRRRGEDAIVAAGRFGDELAKICGGVLRLTGGGSAGRPVQRRVAVVRAGHADGRDARPALGRLRVVGAKPRQPAESPLGGDSLFRLRIALGELEIDRLRGLRVRPRLEHARLEEQRIVRFPGLGIVGDEAIQGGERALAVLLLLDLGRLEKPRRALLPRGQGEGAGGGGKGDVVAAGATRAVHHHAEGLEGQVHGRPLGEHRFRLGTRLITQTGRDDFLRSLDALGRRGRHGNAPRLEPSELPRGRVRILGGGRGQPELAEHRGRFGPSSRRGQRLAHAEPRSRRFRVVGEAIDEASPQSGGREIIAGAGGLLRGKEKGGRHRSALRRRIRRLLRGGAEPARSPRRARLSACWRSAYSAMGAERQRTPPNSRSA
jgi:hypothetical protein